MEWFQRPGAIEYATSLFAAYVMLPASIAVLLLGLAREMGGVVVASFATAVVSTLLARQQKRAAIRQRS